MPEPKSPFGLTLDEDRASYPGRMERYMARNHAHPLKAILDWLKDADFTREMAAVDLLVSTLRDAQDRLASAEGAGTMLKQQLAALHTQYGVPERIYPRTKFAYWGDTHVVTCAKDEDDLKAGRLPTTWDQSLPDGGWFDSPEEVARFQVVLAALESAKTRLGLMDA